MRNYKNRKPTPLERVIRDKTKRTTFILLGRGRLASQLGVFLKRSWNNSSLNRENVGAFLWIRDAKSYLDRIRTDEVSADRKVFLLAVSDSALTRVVSQLRHLFPQSPLIHFSGSFFSEDAIGIHFPFPFLYKDRAIGQKAPFTSLPITLEEEHRARYANKNIREFLRIFKGPRAYIRGKDKVFYHAICVVSSSVLLSMKSSIESSLKRLSIPEKHLDLLWNASVLNWSQLGTNALNGPLVRKDFKTIRKHLVALKAVPYLRNIYKLSEKEVKSWPSK